jgi:DNA-binding LacI/PurR family transcriptional regulator
MMPQTVQSKLTKGATEKLVNAAGIPIVETWDYQPRRKPIQVGFSHVEVGRQAAAYLCDQGYRRIAFVQNSISGDFSAIERSDGYAAVMRERGLTPAVFVPTEPAPFDAGRQALETLAMQKKEPGRCDHLRQRQPGRRRRAGRSACRPENARPVCRGRLRRLSVFLAVVA